MGPVAAETKDELADALKRIEELEGLIAEYILREAIMQMEIEASLRQRRRDLDRL